MFNVLPSNNIGCESVPADFHEYFPMYCWSLKLPFPSKQSKTFHLESPGITCCQSTEPKLREQFFFHAFIISFICIITMATQLSQLIYKSKRSINVSSEIQGSVRQILNWVLILRMIIWNVFLQNPTLELRFVFK